MEEIGAFERKSAAGWERPERAVLAYRAVVVALVAGVAETLVRAALVLEDPGIGLSGVAAGLGVRAAIYLTVFWLAARMLFGSRWARGILAVGLGTAGLASLVAEPLSALLAADSTGALFTGWTPASVLIGLFRTAHILAVLVAVPAAVLAGNRVQPTRSRVA
ncbi:hypothetical protein ACFV4K_32285 [Nocardia sp. NPDC059764]|uniref:hypothetical protein n=1 Tax=Nocardia sp. NPDC059764 TaxID=3346939 RepID=UPI00365E4366